MPHRCATFASRPRVAGLSRRRVLLVPTLAAAQCGTATGRRRPRPAPQRAVAAATPRARPRPGQPGQPHPGAKGDVIRLNRDLLVLEEELLFPANTQVALFVSMDVGKLFELDSVQIKLDDKLVTNYLYTPLEVQALHRGGVQRVYLGNLKSGEHEIVAFFTGEGPHERDYKRGATIKFDKGTDAKYIELRIKDSTRQAAARVRRQGLAVAVRCAFMGRIAPFATPCCALVARGGARLGWRGDAPWRAEAPSRMS